MTYIVKAILKAAKGECMQKCKSSFIKDEEIVDLYWNRDETAIKATDIKYGQLLLKIAYNILGDRNDAEECQNDTYLGTWNAIPPTRPTFFSAFITQIVRRIAINRYKKKRTKKYAFSEFAVSIEELYEVLFSDESVEAALEAKEIGRLTSEYVRGLSKQNRYIFIGRFYIGDSVNQIANELHLTSSSIYKALEKIKNGLKVYFQSNGVIV